MSFKFEQEQDNVDPLRLVVRMSVIKGECMYSVLLDETSFSSAYVELADIEKCFTGDQIIDQHTSADYSIFERPDGSLLDVHLNIRYSKSQKLKSVCETFTFTLTKIERDLQLAEIVRLTNENETMAKKIQRLETDDIPSLKQENENLRKWIDYLKTYQIGYFDFSKFKQPVPLGIFNNYKYGIPHVHVKLNIGCTIEPKLNCNISLKLDVGNSPIIEDPVIRYVFEHDRFKKYHDFFKKVDDYLSYDVTLDYVSRVADTEFPNMSHEEKTKYFINYHGTLEILQIILFSSSRSMRKHLLFHSLETDEQNTYIFFAENFQNIYQSVSKVCQRAMEVVFTYYDLHTEYLLRGKVMLPPTLFGSKFYMIDHPSGDPETVTHEFDTLNMLLNPPQASDKYFLNPNIGFYQTPDEFI